MPKNPKMVYSYVNSKKTVRDSIRAFIDENGKRVEDKAEIVKMLNDQFKSVFEIDNGDRPFFERERSGYEWEDLKCKSDCVIMENNYDNGYEWIFKKA